MNCFGLKKELQVSLLRTTGFEVSDLYIYIYIEIEIPPSVLAKNPSPNATAFRPDSCPFKGGSPPARASLAPSARSLRSRLIELGVVHQQLLQEGDLPALDGLSSAPQLRTSAGPHFRTAAFRSHGAKREGRRSIPIPIPSPQRQVQRFFLFFLFLFNGRNRWEFVHLSHVLSRGQKRNNHFWFTTEFTTEIVFPKSIKSRSSGNVLVV